MAQEKESSSQQGTKKPQHMSVADCMERINTLELLISKLAVMVGQGNMLNEFGIKRWEPGKKDMRKYK